MLKTLYKKTLSKLSSEKQITLQDFLFALQTELLSEGVIEIVAKDIVYKIEKKLQNLQKISKTTIFNTFEIIKTAFTEILEDIFGKQEIVMQINEYEQNNILITGNYGVGKTSFCAKLAKHYSDLGYKVSIATIDTTRHGSQQQLKLLTSKLRVNFIEIGDFEYKSPFQIMSEILIICPKTNILIIDSFAIGDSVNQGNLLQITSGFDFNETIFLADAIHGASSSDLLMNIAKLNLHISGVCFSKFDGSINFGSVINTKILSLKPIYFYSDGETIADIQKFNPNDFVKKVVASIEFSGDKATQKTSDTDILSNISISSFPDLKEYIKLKTDKYGKICNTIDSIVSMMTHDEIKNPMQMSYDKKKKIATILGIELGLINKLIILFRNISQKSFESGKQEGQLVYDDLIDE